MFLKQLFIILSLLIAAIWMTACTSSPPVGQTENEVTAEEHHAE